MAIDLSTAPASVNFGAASAQFGVTFAAGQWQVAATGACWIAIGANPTAVAHNAGNIFIPANYPITINVPVLSGGANAKIAVIQDAAGGWISISANL